MSVNGNTLLGLPSRRVMDLMTPDASEEDR